MMTCRQLVEKLLEFLDGELPPEQHALAQDHLQRCPPCVAYVETYRLTIHLSRRLPPAPLPPTTAARCKAALEAHQSTNPPLA
jgi:anti-sigma factor RsiW